MTRNVFRHSKVLHFLGVKSEFYHYGVFRVFLTVRLTTDGNRTRSNLVCQGLWIEYLIDCWISGRNLITRCCSKVSFWIEIFDPVSNENRFVHWNSANDLSVKLQWIKLSSLYCFSFWFGPDFNLFWSAVQYV